MPGRAGAREAVKDSEANLFEEQTPESLNTTPARFDALETPVSPETCRENALTFSPEHFDRCLPRVTNAPLQEKTSYAFATTA